jgi:nitroimidazol reductase NimA-like FMN-containing flavoprotein (pyridoxamine 5'-phosphate oxidase superfamily)
MAESPVTKLSDEQCWKLLGGSSFGRLATSALGMVDIMPINYVVDKGTLVFRTAPGSKLLEISVSNIVAFEIDNYRANDAWSVVLKGTAEMITNPYDIVLAEALPLNPWVPTDKPIFVRITPTDITGRHFSFGTGEGN